MSTRTPAAIVSDLAGILQNFEDREYSGTIDASTQLFGDLGFVSIDAVILGEKLESHYGQRIPFNKYLAQLQQSGAEDVSVGSLAEFLAEHLDETGGEAAT